MKDLMQLLKFVRGETRDESTQAQMLASLLTEAPPEDFQPKTRLPVINDLPAFSIEQPGVGGELSGITGGVAAPIPNQESQKEPSLGELLVGDVNG